MGPLGAKHLAQPTARAPRRRQNEYPIPFVHLIGFFSERERCQTLQNGSACIWRRYCIGDLDGLRNRRRSVFGISTRSHPHHSVVLLESFHPGPYRDDVTCGFFAQDFWLGRRVEPGAEIGVDVVYADVGVLHEDFAFFGLRNWEVGLVLEHFRTAGFLDHDPLHGLGQGCHCSQCLRGLERGS